MLEGRVQPVGGKLPRATSMEKDNAPVQGASRDGADVESAVVASLASLLQHKHQD
jgi:hypothetical protein